MHVKHGGGAQSAAAAPPKKDKCKSSATKAAPTLSAIEYMPEGVLLKILGYLPSQDVAQFEAASSTCRSAGQQFWAQPTRTSMPCHVPPGPGAVKRAALQQAQVLEGFPEDEMDDPRALIGWIGGKTERARVARYGLLARLAEEQWLEPEHLRMILSMCVEAKRIDEACAWLRQLMARHPEALESICVTVTGDMRDEALVRTCLSSGFRSQALAQALAQNNFAECVLAAMPPNAPDDDWSLLAAQAVRAEAVETVELLVKARPGLKESVARVLNERCRLSEATVARLFTLLIQCGGEHLLRWEIFTSDMNTALSRLELIHALGVDFNRVDSTGHTLLTKADHPDVYRYLLSHGADPCVMAMHGATTLHLLARKRSCTEFVKDTVASGVDVNARDLNGCTALHLADNVLFLIEAVAAGGDLLLRDLQGSTALGTIFRRDRRNLGISAALLFLAKGGDAQEVISRIRLSQRGSLSNAALALLLEPERHVTSFLMGHISNKSRKQVHDFIELVAHRGFSFGRSNHCGQTVAHFAALGGAEAETIQILKANGAPIDREDFYGCTPLFYAAARGHVDTCVALVQAGAQIERIHSGAMGQLLKELTLHGHNPGQARMDRGSNHGNRPAPPALRFDFGEQEIKCIRPTLQQAKTQIKKSPRLRASVAVNSGASTQRLRPLYDIAVDIIRVTERENVYGYYDASYFDLTGHD